MSSSCVILCHVPASVASVTRPSAALSDGSSICVGGDGAETPKPRIPNENEGPAADQARQFRECLDVVHGNLTCCACRHASGQPCDREELVLPIMGLFAEIYRDRHGETRDLYEAMFADGSSVDDYFPSHFDYETPFGQVVRKPLFGDLPRAIMDRVDREHGTEIDTSKYLTPGADARFTAPLDEQLSNPRKLGRPRLFRQRTSKSAPDDVDAMTTVTSFASSTRASSGRVVTDAGTTTPERTPASPPEQVAGLAERRSKRSAVVRLASAPLLDVDDEPLSP